MLLTGAETGAGGRMRDTHATGTGSIMGAGTAGYCVGNLQLDGYGMPWEDKTFQYPPSLASPKQILIDASNGASDYGNKFGEPLICGYTRTFGQRLVNGERREWIKPIMFSGGVGQIDHRHLAKGDGEISHLVIKIGGPAYRIGMGGGAASSMASGSNNAELDFNAVQRGDAEMSQKLWRVVRSCVELGDKNPIVQIHDQGAGGNCNVLKEIIYPLGGTIEVRAVKVGDETLSVMEIWGAEYQENDAILIKPESRDLLQSICDRERCLMQVRPSPYLVLLSLPFLAL
jgi:phosphoribosylformylglycinamidine synthase